MVEAMAEYKHKWKIRKRIYCKTEEINIKYYITFEDCTLLGFICTLIEFSQKFYKVGTIIFSVLPMKKTDLEQN